MIALVILLFDYLVVVTSQIDPLCSILGAINIRSLTVTWNCTVSGNAVNPCGVNPWDGLHCTSVGGMVTSIIFTNTLNLPITGTLMVALRL